MLIAAFIILSFATLWFQLAPDSIINLFGSGNELYNEFSRKCLRIFLALIIFDACELAGSIFFQAIGKPVQATALIMTRQIILQVPLMYIFSRLYGVEGLLYAGPVDSFTVGTMAMILLWLEIKKMRRA